MSKEVDETAQMQIDEAQRHRGWISGSYAQFEYLIADLIMNCRTFEEYGEFTQKLPYKAETRIKRLREILAAEGPLKGFSSNIEPLLDEFEDLNATRNILAHGFADATFYKNGSLQHMTFRKWQPTSENDANRMVRNFSMLDLQREATQFKDFAQRAVAAFRDIHEHFGWVGD